MLFIALLLFQLTPVRAAAPPRAFSSSVAARDTISQMEKRAFELVNDERKREGLPRLVWSDKLAGLARGHSKEMAEFGYVNHMDREGREVAERARDAGITGWRALGENIAFNRGYRTPIEEAVVGWMNSPHHRDNILSDLWIEGGIGIAVSPNGGYYLTQVFYKGR
jgi:uncharacterized protein YkwD